MYNFCQAFFLNYIFQPFLVENVKAAKVEECNEPLSTYHPASAVTKTQSVLSHLLPSSYTFFPYSEIILKQFCQTLDTGMVEDPLNSRNPRSETCIILCNSHHVPLETGIFIQITLFFKKNCFNTDIDIMQQKTLKPNEILITASIQSILGFKIKLNLYCVHFSKFWSACYF